jgi:hypothetical protein
VAKDARRGIGPIGSGKESAPFAIAQILPLSARIEQRRRVSALPAKAHGVPRIPRHAPQCAIVVQGLNLKNMSASDNFRELSCA